MTTTTVADQITTLLGLPEHQEAGLTDREIATAIGRPVASVRRTRNMLESKGRVKLAPFCDGVDDRVLHFVAVTPASV